MLDQVLERREGPDADATRLVAGGRLEAADNQAGWQSALERLAALVEAD
jgi:hypothetical protein